MNEGGDFLLVLWAPTLACPASSPTDLIASQHVARKQDHCSASLGWATSHAHNPAQSLGTSCAWPLTPNTLTASSLLAGCLPFSRLRCGNGGCRAECLEFRTSAWESHIG
jgi:hypothetical protein